MPSSPKTKTITIDVETSAPIRDLAKLEQWNHALQALGYKDAKVQRVNVKSGEQAKT